MQIEEPHDLRSGTTQEGETQIEKPQDLKGRGQEEKEPQITREQKQVETIPTTKGEVSKIQPLEVKN